MTIRMAGILSGEQPISVDEWKIQCGRIISLLFGLAATVASLSAISGCDYFQTNATITNQGSPLKVNLSVGLFDYSIHDFSSSIGAECRRYGTENDDEMVDFRLYLAQIFAILSPILSMTSCLMGILDTWIRQKRSRRTVWIMALAWFLAPLAQFFGFLALQGKKYCQGIDGFGYCERSSGARLAATAIFLNVMALLWLFWTLRGEIRVRGTEHLKQKQINRRSGAAVNNMTTVDVDVHRDLEGHDDVTMDITQETIVVGDEHASWDDLEEQRATTTGPFSCTLSEIGNDRSDSEMDDDDWQHIVNSLQEAAAASNAQEDNDSSRLKDGASGNNAHEDNNASGLKEDAAANVVQEDNNVNALKENDTARNALTDNNTSVLKEDAVANHVPEDNEASASKATAAARNSQEDKNASDLKEDAVANNANNAQDVRDASALKEDTSGNNAHEDNNASVLKEDAVANIVQEDNNVNALKENDTARNALTDNNTSVLKEDAVANHVPEDNEASASKAAATSRNAQEDNNANGSKEDVAASNAEDDKNVSDLEEDAANDAQHDNDPSCWTGDAAANNAQTVNNASGLKEYAANKNEKEDNMGFQAMVKAMTDMLGIQSESDRQDHLQEICANSIAAGESLKTDNVKDRKAEIEAKSKINANRSTHRVVAMTAEISSSTPVDTEESMKDLQSNVMGNQETSITDTSDNQMERRNSSSSSSARTINAFGEVAQCEPVDCEAEAQNNGDDNNNSNNNETQQEEKKEEDPQPPKEIPPTKYRHRIQ